MYRSLALLAACLASFGVAAPVEKGKEAYGAIGDVDILNYALTLEYLERKFYVDGLKNYTKHDFYKAGFSKEFYENLKGSHVDFLAGALGDKAIKEPSFSFPVKDASSFVGLASVLEGVGVAAYLGAAGSIANKAYLGAAGSILTVEARHSSYIRSALKQKPAPTAYDAALDFNQVFSLASQFVTGFAEGTKVPFKAFPALTASPSKGTKYCPGKGSVVFKGAKGKAEKSEKYSKGAKVHAVFYSGMETYYVPVEASDKGDDYTVRLPGADYGKKGRAAPAGQTYITLSTADGKSVTAKDENTIAGVAIIEIGC
ncbi:hypothetical protein CDD83_1317 [Cordyceps sp. RAO-2017]|nr:hypothetical protein CDD83_1317 [Cordyceps sp. RAO-2017]